MSGYDKRFRMRRLRACAKVAAAAVETVWRTLPINSLPPITRMAVLLMGEEVTVNDAKARRALGYRAEKSIDEGLREMAR